MHDILELEGKIRRALSYIQDADYVIDEMFCGKPQPPFTYHIEKLKQTRQILETILNDEAFLKTYIR